MDRILEINDLKKSFRSNFLIRSFQALKGINLGVSKGEIYGFLGPNGAGKTTTIKCLMGLIKPDAGTVRIDGQPAANTQIRKRIGFLPENPYFYDYLTAMELMIFNGRLFGMADERIREVSKGLFHLIGLEGKEKIKLRKFSKGMLQRLGLAQALLHDPEVLILDEPFSGLDPSGRKELRDIILYQKEMGKTIFFSSHILQDVEMIADRVGIILAGRMAREGRLTELIARSANYHEVICGGIEEKLLQTIHNRYIVKDGQYALKIEEESQINEIIESIIHNGGRILSITPVKMSLEDIFMKEMAEGT